jgi:hypothetical protein
VPAVQYAICLPSGEIAKLWRSSEPILAPDSLRMRAAGPMSVTMKPKASLNTGSAGGPFAGDPDAVLPQVNEQPGLGVGLVIVAALTVGDGDALEVATVAFRSPGWKTTASATNSTVAIALPSKRLRGERIR